MTRHTGPVWALWWGGANYSAPSIERDLESFSSLASARYHFGLRLWDYGGRTPCVTNDAEMQIFLAEPRELVNGLLTPVRDPYPDRRLFIGPRGGIRMEAC